MNRHLQAAAIVDPDSLLVNWNAGTPPGAGNAFPEPASAAMLAVGVVAIMRRRPV